MYMRELIHKVQRVHLLPSITLVCLMTLSPYSNAEIFVHNFNLGESSVSFDIDGTMPANPPGSGQFALFFSNPLIFDNPGFALGEFTATHDVSFSGGQFVERVATGGTQYGDYFYVFFAQDSSGTTRSLLPGETVSGRLVAEWSEPAFNPSAVSQLDVYWGTDWAAGLANSGVLLTTVQVPEPHTLGLLGLGLLMGVRRRDHCPTNGLERRRDGAS
jgi:hypothetical protein